MGWDRDLRTILEDVILAPDAPLYNDPEHLIREEADIREPGPYFGVMEAIARGYTSPTAIGGRLQISSQLVTRFLQRLADLGYVARVEPVEPQQGGRARGYWKISDPYFRVWFRFVFRNRSRLSRGRVSEVADEIGTCASAGRLTSCSRIAAGSGSAAIRRSVLTRSTSGRGGRVGATSKSTSQQLGETATPSSDHASGNRARLGRTR